MASKQNSNQSDQQVPSFPLLWESVPDPWRSRCIDLEQDNNLTLSMDGKGVYLDGIAEEELRPSHRLAAPFPLTSAVSSDLFAGSAEESTTTPDGITLPFLAGAIPQSDRDPLTADIVKYWNLHKSAARSCCRMRVSPEQVLLRLRDATVTTLPRLSGALLRMIRLTHFITEKPVFKGWDTGHNWLYGGGCVTVLSSRQLLVHASGDMMGVAELSGCSSGAQCPLAVHAEDVQRISLPGDAPVNQIHATDGDDAAVAMRAGSAAALHLAGDDSRLREADRIICAAACPLTAVVAPHAGHRRWACVDATGCLRERDFSQRSVVSDLQLPEVSRPLGWFGLDPIPASALYQAACWDRLYMVDTRAGSATVTFRLSDNGSLFPGTDRLHAVRRSVCRDHLCLATSSRHLVVLDDRMSSMPVLRSRLMLPQAPVYLSSVAWRSGGELVAVAAQSDRHVQCVAYDWTGGGDSQDSRQLPAELGLSRLLSCGRPLVERSSAAGLDVIRRVTLPLAGLATQSLPAGDVYVYTTNSWGDVLVHPLTPQPPPTHARTLRRRRRKCLRAVDAWCTQVEQQRREHDRTVPLYSRGVGKLACDLTELLAPPVEEPEPAPREPPPWETWWKEGGLGELKFQPPPPTTEDGGSRSEASATGASTTDMSDIEYMLSDWESDGTREEDAPLTVEEEMREASFTLAGSRRRALVPRCTRLRRKRVALAADAELPADLPGTPMSELVSTAPSTPQPATPARQTRVTPQLATPVSQARSATSSQAPATPSTRSNQPRATPSRKAPTSGVSTPRAGTPGRVVSRPTTPSSVDSRSRCTTPLSSSRTPSRQLPVTPQASFTQFSMDLFDD